MFVGDAQIEPGMRERGILPLRFQQFRNSGLGLSGAKQSESVIDTLTNGIRREFERTAQDVNGLLVSIGVFVKRFAEIAIFPEFFSRGFRFSRECGCGKEQDR
jgi:hypothetical protein